MRRFLVRAFLPSPAVGVAVAAFLATLARPDNPDTLWHLAIGKWIIAHHAVPDISRFYYSATTGFGYDYCWLSQALLFGAYQYLGGAGVAMLSSVVAGSVFYFLYKTLEQENANVLVNVVVLSIALVTITAYLSGRPAMFTVAFVALEIFILSDFVDRKCDRRSANDELQSVRRSAIGIRHSLWLIPPLTALWVNLHPGFPVALLLILAFLPLAQKGRDRWTLAACLAATVLAVIVNPYGWKMYLMPLEIARSLSMLRGLSEWSGVSGWETVIWGCLVALVTCGLSLRRQPVPVILLIAVAALVAGVSNRNMPLFGVITVFALGRTLLQEQVKVKAENADLRVSTSTFGRFAGRLIRKFDVRFEGAGGWFWALAVPLLLAGAVRLGASPMNLEFNFSGYPEDAARYVEERNLQDNLFVRETWSGYLLWTMPDRKLFYDAKGGFSREAVEEHSELVRPKPNWRGVAERNGMSTFLLERGSPLAVVLSEASDWRRAYSDSLAEVFVHEPTDSSRITHRSSLILGDGRTAPSFRARPAARVIE